MNNLSKDQRLRKSLEKKVSADDWHSITVDELVWHWKNQFYSTIGQATLQHLERLQEGLHDHEA